ncbi:MAG TPA: APC family permease [Gaiella sp.]
MDTETTKPARTFDHLREHSIGLPEVLFQSITHMAPAAAVAFSILVSVGFAGQALPLSVLLATIACVLVASSIGQLAKQMPSAGGLYTYVSRALGPRAGFFTGWCFLLFEPLVAPLLFLIFAWATEDVVKNEIGWDIGWAWWVLVAAAIVFFLTYRDVRLSTRAGVVLGAIEISIFAALAIWMLVSNWDTLTLQAFNPENRNPDASSDFSGVFKGMIFAVLAFIGFEAAAPLGEEAKNPRRTIPRAVVWSAVLVGTFYVLCSYAWVYGAGFDNFLTQATENADPWRALGKVFWSTGWILVFFAILNSAIANANAGVNAATRVLYAMARNGAMPHQLARTHPVHRTPHVAIILDVVGGAIVALLLGWKWGPLLAFATIATAITVVVILIYIAVCIGTVVFYLRERRSEFNVFLHLIFPVLGAVAFVFPLYYQFKDWPDNPLGYGNWVALVWVAVGIVLTIWVSIARPSALEQGGRVFVEDETASAAAPAGR